MRFSFYVLLAIFIIWIWPIIFQKSAVDIPADSSLRELTDVEQKYYREIFDYTMTAVPAGESFEWQTVNGMGKIHASTPFTSKSGAFCRNFWETYAIGGENGKNEGIACKRDGQEGWCRLKKTHALTCAMESPGGIVEKTVRSTEDVIKAGKDALGKVKNWGPLD